MNTHVGYRGDLTPENHHEDHLRRHRPVPRPRCLREGPAGPGHPVDLCGRLSGLHSDRRSNRDCHGHRLGKGHSGPLSVGIGCPSQVSRLELVNQLELMTGIEPAT